MRLASPLKLLSVRMSPNASGRLSKPSRAFCCRAPPAGGGGVTGRRAAREQSHLLPQFPVMTDAKYVLCQWEKRLWPAKVTAFSSFVESEMTFGDSTVFIRLCSLGVKAWRPDLLACVPGFPPLHQVLVWHLGASISRIVFNCFSH